MKVSASILTMLAASLTLPLHAQQSPTVTKDVLSAYDQIKTYLVKAAEEMPENNYDFQPTKEVRPFGQWIDHVADTQNRACSGILGSPQNAKAVTATSKADIVAALKDSFNTCDAAYNGLTEQNEFETVSAFRGNMLRLLALEKISRMTMSATAPSPFTCG